MSTLEGAPGLWRTGARRIFLDRYGPSIAMGIVLLVLLLLGSIVSPQFRAFSNLVTVFRRSCVVAVAAIGCNFAIITGGIDLSGGAVIGIAGTIAALLAAGGMEPWLSVVVAMGVGAAVGTASGWIITRVRVNPFITTFGMMTILRGLTYPLTERGSIQAGTTSPDFLLIERGAFLGIPNPIVAMLIVLLVCHVILAHTAYGRRLFAIGSSEAFAAVTGVNAKNTRWLAYVISACAAGLAGAFLASRTGMAARVLGEGYELNILTAAILGGTRLGGGRGTAVGAVIGASIVAYLGNLLNILGVQAYYQFIINGLVLLVAVMLAGFWSRK